MREPRGDVSCSFDEVGGVVGVVKECSAAECRVVEVVAGLGGIFSGGVKSSRGTWVER